VISPEQAAKKALIAAALERAKQQRDNVPAPNTATLTTEQQAEIAAIEARRAQIREQAKPHLPADE
jgi:electron transport complex protein RnfC